MHYSPDKKKQWFFMIHRILMADLGESAKGTSPSAALRTGRDPLASSGSHQAKLLPTPTFQ